MIASMQMSGVNGNEVRARVDGCAVSLMTRINRRVTHSFYTFPTVAAAAEAFDRIPAAALHDIN